MSDHPAINTPKTIQGFFAERISGRIWVGKHGPTSCLKEEIDWPEWSPNSEPPALLDQIFSDTIRDKEVRVHELGGTCSLVIATVLDSLGEHLLLLARIEGSPALARQLVESTLETWNLQNQIDDAHVALNESAMQLAQSFEEHDWLRGFARNATSISSVSNANEIASGILQPLGYLLRAQEVFLIVHPEETERSGLVSAKFSLSSFSIESIAHWLRSEGFNDYSPPLVKNHLNVDTSGGTIQSVVAVSLAMPDHCLGALVAINRSIGSVESSLPCYDPEFGSGDVGLLEEAAVLLNSQAQNLRLLVQSNQLFLGTLHAMSRAIDARDKYTQGHSERVARLSYELSKIFGLTDQACQEIYLAGILHDVGKLGIPDRVLLKSGQLTDEEYRIIQQHPEIGHRIVEQLDHLQFVLPGVLYHHERWDGKGYPHGLAGTSIPLMARIMAVADAFDAMTSSRPYRSAMPVSKAHAIIQDGANKQWDSEVVKCIDQWIKKQHPNNPPANESIIPQDSPVDYVAQAVMTLIR